LLKTLEATLDSPGRLSFPTIGDRAPPHNHCHSHQFFLQGISWLLLFDVVGRRPRSPLLTPFPLLEAKVHRFLLHAGLLFYPISLPRTDSTVMQKPLPLLLFFCIPLWSSWRPLHSRRTISVTPTHRIPRFLTVQTFFFDHFFPVFHPPLYHMACHFRVNSLTPGICSRISPPHLSHPPPPFPLRTPPLCLSIRLAGVFSGFGRSDSGLRMWLVPGVPSLSQSPWFLPLQRTSAVPFVRIRIPSSLFRPSSRRAIMDPTSPFCKLVV